MVSSVAGLDVRAWLPAVTALVAGHAALVLGMAAVILLVPAAVWLAVRE
jgi:hypothetical protein